VLLRVEKWCSVLVRVVVIRTLRSQGEAQLLRVVVAGEVIDPRHAAVLASAAGWRAVWTRCSWRVKTLVQSSVLAMRA
jgi:hypothetical protein